MQSGKDYESFPGKKQLVFTLKSIHFPIKTSALGFDVHQVRTKFEISPITQVKVYLSTDVS